MTEALAVEFFINSITTAAVFGLIVGILLKHTQ